MILGFLLFQFWIIFLKSLIQKVPFFFILGGNIIQVTSYSFELYFWIQCTFLYLADFKVQAKLYSKNHFWSLNLLWISLFNASKILKSNGISLYLANHPSWLNFRTCFFILGTSQSKLAKLCSLLLYTWHFTVQVG